MARGPAAGQLTLDIEAPVAPPPSLPRIAPTSPITGPAPFDDVDWFFEPWWPGAQAIVYVEGGRIQLQSGHLADVDGAFPELASLAGQFAAGRLIVAGTILVLDQNGMPDTDLLRRRLTDGHGADGWAAFVASDLLWLGSESLTSQRFEDRRSQLTRQLREGDNCVVGRGLHGEGLVLARAAASMGIGEISARRLDARYRPGAVDDSWLRLPVSEVPAPATRPLLTLLQRLPL